MKQNTRLANIMGGPRAFSKVWSHSWRSLSFRFSVTKCRGEQIPLRHNWACKP